MRIIRELLCNGHFFMTTHYAVAGVGKYYIGPPPTGGISLLTTAAVVVAAVTAQRSCLTAASNRRWRRATIRRCRRVGRR